MGTPGWSEVRALFQSVVELVPAERVAALSEAPADVRSEVEALLAAHEQAETATAEIEGPGTQIGRYRLLEEIGSGGFGVVYRAEQREPVRRRIALKIIKRGMDTDQVVARFEAERQALALMDHPHVAKVLDGGATMHGRPYFVMELVAGVPITEYCDRVGLTTPERLTLFADVCRAVQHAHQKGIIHRDLKPSNVLVAEQDGKPVPKIIDFGVAKATQHHLTQRTLFTELRQIVGTPEYMAPEQAEMNGVDVDTRADIYSLGVVLYELLTGTKPFDLERLLDSGYGEVLRTIREVDPPKPSTRISTMGAELDGVAAKRHTPPRVLGRLVRGDLDWIVMRALEKDRSRRYDSASALAEDVERHLANEPVLAGPPSRAYRVHKYVKRHRAGLLATAVVFVALTAGLAAALTGLDRARAAERDAALQRDRAEAGEADARRGETKATATLDLMLRALHAANPYSVPNPNFTVREFLDQTAAELEPQPPSDPQVEAAVREVIGAAYDSLGLLDEAEPHLARALELRRRTLGEDHLDTAAARTAWAGHLYARCRYREAAQEATGALAVYRSAGREYSLGAVTCLRTESLAYWGLARFDEAEATAREAVNLCEETGLQEDVIYVTCLKTLAQTLQGRGEPRGAAATMERAFEVSRTIHGDENPATQSARLGAIKMVLASASLDQLPAIEADLEDVLTTMRRTLGEDHSLLVGALDCLGSLHQHVMRFDAAEQSYRDALTIAKSTYGGQHDAVLDALIALGRVLALAKRVDAAEETSTEALALARELGGEQDVGTVSALLLRAAVLGMQGRGPEAQSLAEEAIALLERTPGSSPLQMANALQVLGDLHLQGEAMDEAEQCYRRGLEIRRRLYGASDFRLCDFLCGLASVEEWRTNLEAAIQLQRQVCDLARVALGEDHLRTLRERASLGALLALSGHGVEAEVLLQSTIGVVERAFQGDHPLSMSAHQALGLLRKEQGDAVASEKHFRKVLHASGTQPGLRKWTYQALLRLSGALVAQGRLAEAQEAWQEAWALAQEMFADGDWRRTDCLIQGANLLLERGELASGERLARSALATLPTRTGARGLYRANALQAVAQFLCLKHDFAEAERLCREAVEIITAVSGPSAPGLLAPLNFRANLRMPQGNLKGAREVALQALRIAKQALGERCVNAAHAHAVLGHIAFRQGSLQEAEDHHRRAVRLYDDLLGPENAAAALACQDLGQLLYRRGVEQCQEGSWEAAIASLGEAEALLRRALTAFERPGARAGPSNSAWRRGVEGTLPNVLYWRGLCLRGQEEFEASSRDLREAVVKAREIWGSEKRSTLALEIELCGALNLQERFVDAEKEARACLPRARKVLPPAVEGEWVTVSTVLAVLGASLIGQERWADAEEVLEESLRLRQEHTPDDAREHSARSLLGEAIRGQGRHAEAEHLLLDGYEGLVETKAHARQIRLAAERLVDLYEAWGKPDEAARWRAELPPAERDE